MFLSRLKQFLFLSVLLHPAVSVAEFTQLTRVGTGFTRPVFVTAPEGDKDRLFVVEKGLPNQTTTPRIRILDLNTSSTLATPFLSLPDTYANGEGGVLGMAFHPDYENNGKFYVNHTVLNEEPGTGISTHIREYTVSDDPNVADPTPRSVLVFQQEGPQHNGGWIGFNPAIAPGQEQYLYITTGEGSFSGGNNAQETDNLFGSVLRIDVDGDDFPANEEANYAIPADNPLVGVAGRDEVWSWGLRNPWRASFDSATGDFWLGDVGGGQREEVNFHAAESPGGENYAWPRREGTVIGDGSRGGDLLPGDTEPVFDFAHGGSDPQNAVGGGYVYRGPDADEQGFYHFADIGANRRFKFDPADPYASVEQQNSILQTDQDGGDLQAMISYGVDSFDNLFAIDYLGSIYRFEPGRIAGDYNGDGMIGRLDYDLWKATYGSDSSLDADGTGDGLVDAADYSYWRDALAKWGDLYPEVASTAAVPEPTALVLVFAVVSFVAVHHRTEG